MIRHIVMWSIKDELSNLEKEKAMLEVKTKIEALKPLIKEIVEADILFNITEKEEFDLVLNSVFKTTDDLNSYATHPDHVQVVNEIKGYFAKRAAVDYEF